MQKSVIILLLSMICSTAFAESLNISYANNTASEKLKGQQIERIVGRYKLDKWWFTDEIMIDDAARSPFSHPVLTLTTTRPNNDLSGLSQLIHEQIHWFEESNKLQVENAIAELKKVYPEVPVGYPNGARSEYSSYLHLIVCLLELDALTEIVGKDKANAVVSTNGKYFYKWIYQTVLSDQDKIRDVLVRHKLYI